MEKNNLQLMLNCILANQTKEISGSVVNKESRSNTLQQEFLQSRVNTQADIASIQSESSKQDFFEIDLLHSTCHLMQEQSKSSHLSKIFSKHFINNKTLYLMIKSKNYQHALLKMVTFTNDLIDLVIQYKEELSVLNKELKANITYPNRESSLQ